MERKLGDESSEGTGEVDGEDERKRGGDGVRGLVVSDVTNCNGRNFSFGTWNGGSGIAGGGCLKRGRGGRNLPGFRYGERPVLMRGGGGRRTGENGRAGARTTIAG